MRMIIRCFLETQKIPSISWHKSFLNILQRWRWRPCVTSNRKASRAIPAVSCSASAREPYGSLMWTMCICLRKRERYRILKCTLNISCPLDQFIYISLSLCCTAGSSVSLTEVMSQNKTGNTRSYRTLTISPSLNISLSFWHVRKPDPCLSTITDLCHSKNQFLSWKRLFLRMTLVPPWGISLHQWCALIRVSRSLPSGSETGRLCSDPADLLQSVWHTAADQSGLQGWEMVSEHRRDTVLTIIFMETTRSPVSL